jgi:membrane protease YdiL (CAAX protease family)
MLKDLLKEAELKPVVILLATPVLLTLYAYYGTPGFFERNLSPLFDPGVLSSMAPDFYNFAAAFLIMFAVPLLIIKFLFRQKLCDFGIQRGDWKYGLAAVVILLPVISVALLLPSAGTEAFEKAYPLFHNAGKLTPRFFFYAPVLMFYYLAFEFFFRGFLLFGLRERFGDFYSILIQTIPTTLIHIGKPEGEIFAAIFSGLLFGYIALRTKSIWYVFLLHWGIGVMLNIFLALV